MPTDDDRFKASERLRQASEEPELLLALEVDQPWHRANEKGSRSDAIQEVPPMYRLVAIEAWKGSREAAIRLQCLRCKHFHPKSIILCTNGGCALHAVRPYQTAWTKPMTWKKTSAERRMRAESRLAEAAYVRGDPEED